MAKSVQPKIIQQPAQASTTNNVPAVKLVAKATVIQIHCDTIQKLASQPQTTNTVSPDVHIVTVKSKNLMSLDTVLRKLHVVKYMVKGDGSCLYHVVSHQAGLISITCQGDEKISMHLRKIAQDVMGKHPAVRLESTLSKLEWLKKQQEIITSNTWGGDVEIRLLAIGLHRDIAVITAASNGSTFARTYPSVSPPIEKIKGGLFNPLSSEQLCKEWHSQKPTPLLLFNGNNHYDSTVSHLA